MVMSPRRRKKYSDARDSVAIYYDKASTRAVFTTQRGNRSEVEQAVEADGEGDEWAQRL